MKSGVIYSVLFTAVMASLTPFWWGRKAAPKTRPALVQLPYAISPRELSRGPAGRHQIALTFDAGYEATDFSALLDTLDCKQVKATFFLTGKWMKRYPVETQLLAPRGHAIGNHSWAHPEYTRLTDDELRDDLLATDRLLEKNFNYSARPLFRPPFGDRDERVLRLLAENGYISIYWTLDTLDSIEPRKTADFLLHRVTDQTDEALDGAIILAHIGYPETCAAMPAIIDNLQSRGFKWVTVEDWLRPDGGAVPP